MVDFHPYAAGTHGRLSHRLPGSPKKRQLQGQGSEGVLFTFLAQWLPLLAPMAPGRQNEAASFTSGRALARPGIQLYSQGRGIWQRPPRPVTFYRNQPFNIAARQRGRRERNNGKWIASLNEKLEIQRSSAYRLKVFLSSELHKLFTVHKTPTSFFSFYGRCSAYR